MKRVCLLWCAAGAVLFLALCGPVGARALTAEEMYLNPATVAPDYYDYDYYSAGYTHNFTNVTSLQVLPALVEGGMDYYFTPCVDYTADITGTDGSVTFATPGPYFVRATSADTTTALFDFGVGFEVFPNETGPTYNWHKEPTPGPNVVAVDPDLVKSQPRFPPGTTVVAPTNWDSLTEYLQTLTNAHVELSGHGSPAAFYYCGSRVLYDCQPATDDWLRKMRGHVKNLTFMSCSTAKGEAGRAFLQKVADFLGESAGYTDVVGGNGYDWFINDDGKRRTFVAPEPSSLLALCSVLPLALILRRRR